MRGQATCAQPGRSEKVIEVNSDLTWLVFIVPAAAGIAIFIVGRRSSLLRGALALLGIGTAYLLYILKKEILPQRIRRHFTPLYNLVSNKYYIDELYRFLFIQPLIRLSRVASKFDLGVIDGAVNGAAWITVILSKISAWIDHYIVDGAVNLVAMIVRLFSLALRRIQTGYIQTYLLIAFFGLAIIILIKLIGG